MVFDFIYSTSLPVAGLLVVGLMCLFGLFGLLVVRRFVLPRLELQHEHSGFVGAMVQSV